MDSRPNKGDFNLVLDVGEFDQMLLEEWCFKTRIMGLRTVDRRVRDYINALQAMARPVDRKP